MPAIDQRVGRFLRPCDEIETPRQSGHDANASSVVAAFSTFEC